MQDLSNHLKGNPLFSILSFVKVTKEENHQGLERTYHIGKNNKVLKTLRSLPSKRSDLSKLDHNLVLDLYPEYEYIFGPYVDANKDEFNLVYILYTNRINQANEINVLYAGRVLQEHDKGAKLDFSETMQDYRLYKEALDARQPLKGKLSNNCYYKKWTFTPQERKDILAMYNGRSVSEPRYNTLRESFAVSIILLDGSVVGINAYRLLYELYHSKKRLSSAEVVSPINGKKGDLRSDNVMSRNLEAEDKAMREAVFAKYGLDTYALENIYAVQGYNRFRGLYDYEGVADAGNRDRMYVKLVKSGTDLQFAMYLSRALMIVKEGRILGENETVDHIDNDKTNDSISNLRIIDRSRHVSEDSIRVEVDPVLCCMCNKHFKLANKEYTYYKLSDTPITCSPRCKKKLRNVPKERKKEMVKAKVISYRYYVLDKETKKRKYFSSTDYKECRQELSLRLKVPLVEQDEPLPWED